MSEYIILQSTYNDAGCLKASLKELGYQFEDHKTAQALVGYAGDRRTQTANIIVRKKHVGHAANDVGFLRKSNGTYEMIISEFDRRKGSDSAINFLEKLKQIYNKNKMVKKLKSLGNMVTSVKTTQDGKIKIKAFG